jgi:UDP-2,3-diacylglucosamine pyrophosphatase LpxH
MPSTALSPSDTDPPACLRVRTVFISDLHLGTPGCRADALLDFLRDVDCQTLYLVGDIIDGWQLRRSWYWPQAHNDVVQKILRKARKGTRVVFVPGNHDEFARRYVQHNFGGVDVVEDAMHVTADGRHLWVTHGDLFDGVVQCAKWLAHLGDVAYEFVLKVNRWFNSARARLGLPYWSLSRYLKLKVKRAVSYVGDFEAAVAREARRRGADGVVCGHIHHAEMREIDGVLYCNDGDWVESLTALVEHLDGRLEIIDRSLGDVPQSHRRVGDLAAPSALEPIRVPVPASVPVSVPLAAKPQVDVGTPV